MTARADDRMRLALSLALLAAWLGAAGVVATVVAPAAFAVLPTRALAGALVGRVLPAVFYTGLAAGLVSAALAWGDRADGSANPRLRLGASLALAAACGVAQLVVAPRIQRVRARIGPSIEALAQDDPLRAAFGRLHAVSVAWMGVGIVAATVAIVAVALSLRARR